MPYVDGNIPLVNFITPGNLKNLRKQRRNPEQGFVILVGV